MLGCPPPPFMQRQTLRTSAPRVPRPPLRTMVAPHLPHVTDEGPPAAGATPRGAIIWLAIAIPTPMLLMVITSARANAANTVIMIRAAPVMMPAVRAMMLIPEGTSSWFMVSRSSLRSSPSMRRETPPPRGLFGISTR